MLTLDTMIEYMPEEANIMIESAIIIADESDIGTDISQSVIHYLSEAAIQENFAILLEKIKIGLLNILDKLKSYFISYITNSNRLIEKYADRVIDYYEKHRGNLPDIVFETYTYDPLKRYPKDQRLSMDEFESFFEDARSSFANGRTYNLYGKTRQKAFDILSKILGPSQVNIDDEKMHIVNTYKKFLRGESVADRINSNTIRRFLNKIKDFKVLKDEITETKKDIESHYKKIKSALSKSNVKNFMKMCDDINNASDLKVSSLREEEVLKLLASSRDMYLEVQESITYLFDTILKVYDAAFTAKIQVIDEYIHSRESLIVKILRTCNIFQQRENLIGDTKIHYIEGDNGEIIYT